MSETNCSSKQARLVDNTCPRFGTECQSGLDAIYIGLMCDHELHFGSKHNFEKYAECRLSEAEYRNNLRKRRFLSIHPTKKRGKR